MLANDAEFLLEVNGMCSVVNTNNYTYFLNSAFILDCENKYLEGEKGNLRDIYMYQNGCTFSYNSIRLIFLQNIFKKIPDAVLFILQNFYQESFLHEFHIHCFLI